MNKEYVMCECPECEKQFIAYIAVKKETLDFDELPETLYCPYCGIKNDIYAVGIVNVEV